MLPASSTVTYQAREGIAWVTMNRPDAMNALNPEHAAALAQAVQRAGDDDGVRALVLIGAGGRAFCTGMDLKWRADEDATGRPDVDGGLRRPLEAVWDCPKPVIAAIDGYCLAGGFQLANRCDIRIATEPSRFGMLEARRGLAAVGRMDTPEWVVPPGEAALILMTGGMMPARRAYDIGLIQSLVPDRPALLAEAERIADEIKRCAPLAIRHIKAVLNTRRNLPTPPAGVDPLQQLAELTAETRRRAVESEDRLEGPRAFAERRPPVWKGR